MTNTTNNEMKCQRCGSTAHRSKDCSLPFHRQFVTVEADKKKETPAEYAARHAANQKKKEEWEKKKKENEKKNALWEAMRAERLKNKDIDVQSNATEVSTVASTTVVLLDEKEIERMVNADKEVMKWAKKFRDIVKLEGLPNLDALQKQKLARKEEVQLEFEYAKGLAKYRVKDEWKKAMSAY